MPIAEVRSRFDEFAAGIIGEDALRLAVREAAQSEPQLAPVYAALALTRAKAGVISTELANAIAAEIDPGSAAPLQGTWAGGAQPPDDADRTVFSPRGRTEVLPPIAVAPPAPAPAPPPARAPAPAPLLGPVPTPVLRDLPVVASRDEGPIHLDEPMYPRREITGATTSLTTATTTGSAWDAPDRLAEPAAPLHIGSVLGSRFELQQELGRGGMGVVYKALDRATAALKDRNPYVAIKVLNDEFKRHPLAVRSLQREARKAQKLAHPNIVKVYDFDRDGGNVYMVMELLNGSSLDEALKEQAGSGFPLDEVIRLLRGLGAGLSYAHELGIVHADFKPSNAFLTADGNIKILDFGVARAARSLNSNEEKTVFDAGALGAVSPPYASLEMLSGGTTPDQRDDIYALGCVLYELIAGKHPFNRIDAVKARSAGLKPARPGKLNREQWRALQGALAFERESRTATVAEVVERFTAPGKAKLLWPALAAGVVLAAGAAWIVPRQWASFAAGDIATNLASADDRLYAQGLDALKAATRQVRTSVLASDNARQALVKRYSAVIEQAMAPATMDFPRARAALQELKAWLPDSVDVAALGSSIDARSRAELQKLTAQRDAAIQQGVLIPQQGKDDLSSVMTRWQRIAPDSPELTEPRIAALYEAAGRKAVAARELETAKSLVDAGLSFMPNNAALLEVQASYQSELEAQKSAARIAQLEKQLLALDSSSSTFLDQVLQNRDALIELGSLSPASPALARLQDTLQKVVQQRVKAQLARGDVAGARELLLNVGELLPEQVLASARASVLEQGRAQETQQLETLDRLRRAVLTGRLAAVAGGGAQDLFESLQRGGASPDLLASARDLLGYGYLRRARVARMSGNAAAAATALAAARSAQPGAVWRARIDAEEKLVTQPAARQAQGAGGELEAARRRFSDTLRASVIGDAEVDALGEALDRLEALGANAQELDSGLRNVEERLIAQITRMQEQSGAYQAQLLARRMSDSLLGSERIAEIYRQLRSTSTEGTRSFEPDVLAQRTQLSKLLAAPAATAAWAESVRGVLQSLGASMRADDPLLQDARRVAGEVFVKAAADARARGRLEEAKSLLASGRTIDPQSAALKQETGTVQVEQQRKQEIVDDSAQREGIDLLKRKLVEQVNAGSMQGAEATANALRRVLAGSVYVSSEVPRLFIAGYAALAKRQMLAGQVDESLQTLAAARRKFGTAPELKNLELRYVVAGDAYDRLSTAVAVNVAEQRGYLEKLRASEGADFHALELMLARTLANRIADQRAANRASVAAAVLAAGRQLFPEHAALLEQGTAGALPRTGLEVR
jgi:serine/threonine protein kinase